MDRWDAARELSSWASGALVATKVEARIVYITSQQQWPRTVNDKKVADPSRNTFFRIELDGDDEDVRRAAILLQSNAEHDPTLGDRFAAPVYPEFRDDDSSVSVAVLLPDR
jgi:hypothetical protein